MIIAVDFDGILCENAFPEIGKPNYRIMSYIQQLIDQGHEVVLWTVRNGEELDKAIEWCNRYGLHFCNVNGPAPSNAEEYEGVYETESRKIFAHVYIDDRNLEFQSPSIGDSGIDVVERLLRRGVYTWKKEEN